MNIKRTLLLTVLGSQCAFAAYLPSSSLLPSSARTVVSLQGGFACMDGSHDTQTFVGGGGNTFTYQPASTSCRSLTWGLSAGNEYTIVKSGSMPMALQLGFEYNNFGDSSFTGNHSVGINPALTQYNYAYTVKSQQLLGNAKLVLKSKKQFYPYAEAAIGVALNHASSYGFTTTQGGAINLTPSFDNRNTTKLSYALGLGVDKDVTNHLRFGVGYRFSYLGNAPLGDGAITLGVNRLPVLFKLNTNNLYANQVLARISYLS